MRVRVRVCVRVPIHAAPVCTLQDVEHAYRFFIYAHTIHSINDMRHISIHLYIYIYIYIYIIYMHIYTYI